MVQFVLMKNEEAIKAGVKLWLEESVIGLNLCPFAHREVSSERVRFLVSKASDEESLLYDLASELERLEVEPEIETTLIIHPFVLEDFLDYNQFLDLGDQLLQSLEFEGVFQIASFHPHYQFQDTQFDDPENYTNRAPYPIIQLLREESLEKAIASYPEVENIPLKNIETMKNLGLAALQERLAKYSRLDLETIQ